MRLAAKIFCLIVCLAVFTAKAANQMVTPQVNSWNNWASSYSLTLGEGEAGSPSITLADVNSDGWPDILAPIPSYSNVEIYWNKSGTNFNATPLLLTCPTGSQPVQVIVGNITGRGFQDVACALWETNFIIWTNQASGSPASAGTVYKLVSTNHPTSLCFVNVNGRLDIALACERGQPYYVEYWTNNGSGIFGHLTNISIGTGTGHFTPDWIEAGDYIGNGLQHLITADYNNNTATLITNRGDNYWAIAGTVKATNSACLKLYDVNGDGKLDILSCNALTDTLQCFTNDGTGVNFPRQTNVAGFNGINSVSVTNNIICVASANNDKLTFLSISNGWITSNSTFSVAADLPFVAVADVNSDGHIDAVALGYNNDVATIATNYPTFTYITNTSGSGLELMQ